MVPADPNRGMESPATGQAPLSEPGLPGLGAGVGRHIVLQSGNAAAAGHTARSITTNLPERADCRKNYRRVKIGAILKGKDDGLTERGRMLKP